MMTLRDELAELKSEVDRGLTLLQMAHECGFDDFAAQLLSELTQISVTALLGAFATDGEPREQYAAIVRRIDKQTERYGVGSRIVRLVSYYRQVGSTAGE